MPYPILTAIAAETSTMAVNHPQTIDFSTLDTLAGAVIAIAAMIVVGLFLFKYGVVKIGGTTDAENAESSRERKQDRTVERAQELLTDRELRRADRAEMRIEFTDSLAVIKELITELKDDMRDYLKTQQECQRSLPEKYIQWEVFNRILNELKEDRMRRWDKFDTHTHGESSGVVVFRKMN